MGDVAAGRLAEAGKSWNALDIVLFFKSSATMICLTTIIALKFTAAKPWLLA